MKVTIWDMDYYYSKVKKNCFNPDVMKISSYHKQMGDTVTLVESKDDIYRPYDLYYIVKEKDKLPHPPKDFFLNPKVKWWGKAYASRIKWNMSDAMLGCRPDYLLYPERNTAFERSEQVRLFNNNAELLPLIQDWTNTFKNKYVIVTDTAMWFSDTNSIIKALDLLEPLKKISFFEPIWLQKIISNKSIKEKFLNLHFSPGSKISWLTIKIEQMEEVISFIKEFKEKFPNIAIGEIIVDWHEKDHWVDKNNALQDFENLKKWIIKCKKEGVRLTLKMPESRFETPYFEVFEELSYWSRGDFDYSWLEHLSRVYGKKIGIDMRNYWNHPEQWHELFRDLLRQTWIDKEFLLEKWKGTRVSENEVPWKLWEKEFKLGI